MTELPEVAEEAETVPFVGAVAPVQVTGVLHVLPVQPAVHAHVKPVDPEGEQVPPFKHGFGEQPVMMREQVGAGLLQVPLVWHVVDDDPDIA